MQISYLSRNIRPGFEGVKIKFYYYYYLSVADRTNVFFKFSRGVYNFRSISVVDSISVMSKYNMMQFLFFYKCKAIQNPLHTPKVSCPQRFRSKSFYFTEK